MHESERAIVTIARSLLGFTPPRVSAPRPLLAVGPPAVRRAASGSPGSASSRPTTPQRTSRRSRRPAPPGRRPSRRSRGVEEDRLAAAEDGDAEQDLERQRIEPCRDRDDCVGDGSPDIHPDQHRPSWQAIDPGAGDEAEDEARHPSRGRQDAHLHRGGVERERGDQGDGAEPELRAELGDRR